MTPNEIEILIHCHVSSLPHPRADVPAVKEALDALVENDLIVQHSGTDGVYSTTDRGKAHMQVLCSMPLPEKIWVVPFGKNIKDLTRAFTRSVRTLTSVVKR